MNDTIPAFVHDFFVTYADALLDRDAAALAELYSEPALVLFPGNHIAVGRREEAEAFFAASWDQYAGIEELNNEIRVIAEAPSCLWVDVAWIHGGQARERFCYQLVADGDGEWRIAVLTPLTVQ